MQWIADNLFVGNKLAAGELRTSDGVRVDLRNIQSPIIVFCSWGDDITPPQQALGWITRPLRPRGRDRRRRPDHRLLAAPDASAISASSFPARWRPRSTASSPQCMDMIDLHAARPLRGGDHRGRRGHRQSRPGRRQVPVPARGAHARRHPRARRQQPEDELRFATAARVSEINQGLYRDLRRSRPCAPRSTEQSAERCAQLHPNRLRFALFSDRNPADAAGRGAGRAGARRPPPGQRRQSVPRDRAGGLGLDHDLAAKLWARRATP